MRKFEQILTEEERRSLVKKQERQIKKLFKGKVDADTIKLNEHLIEEAATYAVALYECNEIIKRDGVVDMYQNGENQYGTKKSVAAELKPKYTATYQSLIRQLSGILPSGSEQDAAAEIMDFLNTR